MDTGLALILVALAWALGMTAGAKVSEYTTQKDCQVAGVTRFGDTAFECRPLPTKAILGVLT